MGSDLDIFDQIVKSTAKDCGIFVTIFGLNEHIKNSALRQKANIAFEGLNLNTERVVAIRIAQAGNDFLPLKSDPGVLVMPSSAYIRLLKFVKADLLRVRQKLTSNCTDSGRASDVHNYVVLKTPSKNVLKFSTCVFSSPSANPSFSMSLGWSDQGLEKLSLDLQPLLILSKDLSILKNRLNDNSQRSVLNFGRLHQVAKKLPINKVSSTTDASQENILLKQEITNAKVSKNTDTSLSCPLLNKDHDIIHHVVKSTYQDSGICVKIFGVKGLTTSTLLKNKVNIVCEGLNMNEERVVSFQITQAGKDFLPLQNDLQAVIMPCSVYIKMLEFVKYKWPNVCTRILKRCQEESESGLDMYDERYKWYKFNDHINVGAGGPVRIKYILYQTNRNQVLSLQTEGIPTPGVQPPLSVTLGWSEEGLGKVSITPKPLGILAKRLDTLKNQLSCKGVGVDTRSGSSTKRSLPQPQLAQNQLHQQKKQHRE